MIWTCMTGLNETHVNLLGFYLFLNRVDYMSFDSFFFKKKLVDDELPTWVDDTSTTCHLFCPLKVFLVAEKSEFKFLDLENLDFNLFLFYLKMKNKSYKPL